MASAAAAAATAAGGMQGPISPTPSVTAPSARTTLAVAAAQSHATAATHIYLHAIAHTPGTLGIVHTPMGPAMASIPPIILPSTSNALPPPVAALAARQHTPQAAPAAASASAPMPVPSSMPMPALAHMPAPAASTAPASQPAT
ncbi:hypothetical protein OBBRIDRAFT_808080 [Obba rivulosa]|uniref:Uncharacterized protein n=1 Tax=Obba rivulosa TaxID=1052685 RepID=A0A8E2DGB5_9APHY|nr:hypothetical protein OBBRIDRAFT_808080 [Obba rivulosa]